MPTLKHLLEDLGLLAVEPNDIRVSGKTYDRIMQQAQESADDDLEEE
ncbi:MAG: hypothetical protein GY845_06105 [Planctomycetes bacterium]|nr:hypothetical protein [Planctomycetota bacterium]